MTRLISLIAFLLSLDVLLAQTLQKGADPKAKGVKRLRFDYLDYRPARYERDKVFEPQDEQPNKGGLLRLYYTNESDKPISLSFWRLNGEDESFWKLSPGLAWSRKLGDPLGPGESGVLELNGTTEEFAAGKKFEFVWIERGSFIPVGLFKSTLQEDTAQISFIGIRPGLAELVVHVRYTGSEPIEFTSAEVLGKKVSSAEWKGIKFDGPGHAIARIKLAEALAPMAVTFVRVALKSAGQTRIIQAHRRAHHDSFMIGTWGIGPDTYQQLKQHHISMGMMSGKREDDFFARDANHFDLHAMVGAKFHDVDALRSIGDHSRAAVLYLADEPDWTTPPGRILHDDEIARHFNPHKPTLVTLCRNVQFFEYAQIVDIPCQDHYSVSAPTSSKWPTLYGTRLEETGIYTRDLRRAAEPKPIWIWSQGLFDWDERPQYPLPTPDELAFQLWQNVGQGAKGILWFTFRQSVGDKYPATREEIRRCGRLLRLIGEDLVCSDPAIISVDGPKSLEVLPILGPDRLYLIITNSDYKIHPKAYQWKPLPSVSLRVTLPAWLVPGSVAHLTPDSIDSIPFRSQGSSVEMDLGTVNAWKVVVIDPSKDLSARMEIRRKEIVADESKTFEK